MRRFNSSCIDSKTGYEMILSECSYNMACDWLSRELNKEDMEILSVEIDSDGLANIFTGRTLSEPMQLSGRAYYCAEVSGRTFYYDEERGYLLGE